MAPPPNRRSGYSRRAQYTNFIGYIAGIAGGLLGAAFLLLAFADPTIFSGLRGLAGGVAAPAGKAAAQGRSASHGLLEGISAYFDAARQNAHLKRELARGKAEAGRERCQGRGKPPPEGSAWPARRRCRASRFCPTDCLKRRQHPPFCHDFCRHQRRRHRRHAGALGRRPGRPRARGGQFDRAGAADHRQRKRGPGAPRQRQPARLRRKAGPMAGCRSV